MRCAWRWLARPYPVFAFRLIIGGFFVAAGLAKLAQPVAFFANQIQAFGILPAGWQWPLAYVLPWLELVTGGFLLAGLLTGWAALAVGAQLAVFALALSAALLRGASLEDCACLPGVKETPAQALARDLAMFVWAAAAARGLPGKFALDDWL